MSTGSVTPFTPNGSTQALAVLATSVTLSFNPGDSLLVYNSGTTIVYATLGITGQTIAATVPVPGTPGSFPIPPGAEHLIGTPSYVGNSETPISQIAFIAAGTGNTVYITPGLGTEY